MGIINEYFVYLEKELKEAGETQKDSIEKAAAAIADAFEAGKDIYSFGSGHSHMITEELYMRAGGLAFIKGILPPELMLHEMPLKSTLLERLGGYAEALLDLCHIQQGDVIIIISNSGTNRVPVEMALEAKQRGAIIIAITSMKHSQRVSARHESGKKLYEIADIVLDNQADYGDAAFMVQGCETPTGPISDFIGVALAQALVVSVTEKLVAKGIEPPLFQSSNKDNADSYNNTLFAKYFDVKHNM